MPYSYNYSYLRGMERIKTLSPVVPATGSAGVLKHLETTRLQSDAGNALTWTFTTGFADNPVISICIEANAASLGAGSVPLEGATITSLSTTAVSLITNFPNTWVHITAQDSD